MLTLGGLSDELHRLVERGLDARIEPAEIADALQAELDELDVMTGETLRGPADIRFDRPGEEGERIASQSRSRPLKFRGQ